VGRRLLDWHAGYLLRVYKNRMRSPHLVVWIDHDHLANLLLNEVVKKLIGQANRVLLKPVGDVYSLLDGGVGSLSKHPVHHAFVYLVRQHN